MTSWIIQSMKFSKLKYWSGWPFPSPGDLLNLGVKPRSPVFLADSLPAEPQRKPKNTGVCSLSLPQQVFQIQESNRDLLHCKWILYQLSYQGSLVKPLTTVSLSVSPGVSETSKLFWRFHKGLLYHHWRFYFYHDKLK